MSVTFRAGWEMADGTIRPMRRCDCELRYLQACERCDTENMVARMNPAYPSVEYPEPYHCVVCSAEMNLSNGNAMDLMRWLGLEATEYGSAKASEVAAKCQRRLWDEARNDDDGKPFEHDGRVIFMGRDPGYLREKTEIMLKIAQSAGDGLVIWS
jgi:hypothetical protein